MKTIIIKHFIDADRLMKDGYRCVGVDRNKECKSQLVFFFEYKEGIMERLVYYKNNKRFNY